MDGPIDTNENAGVEPGVLTATTKKQSTNGNSLGAQCARLLQRLRERPVTTFEAMRELDIYHCPARILQLRKQGHLITTVWKQVQTEAGTWHKVGMYVLTTLKK